jgi:hypothetical protein
LKKFLEPLGFVSEFFDDEYGFAFKIDEIKT